MRTAGKRGTAIERRPGVWLVQASKPSGQKVSRTLRTEARSRPGVVPLVVQRELAKLVAEVDTYSVAEAEGALFSQAADEWLRANELAPSTRYGYGKYLDRYVKPRWGDTPIAMITPRDLSAWYRSLHDELGLSPATIRQTHAIVRGILKMAVRDGVAGVTVNAATQASLPSGGAAATHAVKAPTPEEVAALMEVAAADPEMVCYLTLSAALGSRRGETTALRWHNIDWEEGSVHVEASIDSSPGAGRALKSTKTHADATLSIGPKVLAVLGTYRDWKVADAAKKGCELDEHGYLFSADPRGHIPWDPSSATHKFSKLRARANVGAHVKLKNLRHYHATQLLSNGVDVRTVAGRLRHASANTTYQFYAKFDEASDRKAAGVFDEIF